MKLSMVWTLACLVLPSFAVEKVVENDKKPKGKTWTIEFTEDLRFGADEEDDVYLWADPSSVVKANSKGHIFMADLRERRVLEFDTKGKFVRAIANRGQGPGELQALADLAILADDSIIALNAGFGVLSKFLFFDSDGNYLKEKGPQGFSKILVSSTFAPDGKHFGGIFVGFNQETSTMLTNTGVLDLDFEVLHQLSSHPQSFNPADFQSQDGIAKFIGGILTNAYKGTGMFSFDKDGNAYSAVSDKYVITKWNKDLKTKELIIKRKYKPIPNTDDRIAAIANQSLDGMRDSPMGSMVNDATVKKVIQKTEFPLVLNPVNGIIPLEDGKILVVHDVNPTNGVQLADIFDEKGSYMGQVTMDQWAFVTRQSRNAMTFKNGFAYTLESDEEDENRIVRYKYTFKKI